MEFLVGPIVGVVIVAAGVWIGTASLREQLRDLSADVASLRREIGVSQAASDHPGDTPCDPADADGSVDVQQIARATGLSEDQVRVVADDLVDRGALAPDGSRYRQR